MKKLLATLTLALLPSSVMSHELTPTYPTLRSSFYDDVYTTTMLLFNRREDVSYYQIEVFDADWNSVPFASETNVIKVEHLERKYFDVYVKKSDVGVATYICTRSKLLKADETSIINSRICSKLK
jgi:hypothetical protein